MLIDLGHSEINICFSNYFLPVKSMYYIHIDSVSEHAHTLTYNLDRKGQQQVVDSLNKEVCPFTGQF